MKVKLSQLLEAAKKLESLSSQQCFKARPFSAGLWWDRGVSERENSGESCPKAVWSGGQEAGMGCFVCSRA